MRVIVRVCNVRDQQVVARIRGQTSDLPVTVIVRDRDVLEPLLSQQLDRAEALSSELDAAAVVWFSEGGSADALLVYVATPASGRVLARRLDAGTAESERQASPRSTALAQATSGLFEQSALVVRFALKGLSEGGTIGVDRGAVLAHGPQRAAPDDAAGEPTALQLTDAAEKAVPSDPVPAARGMSRQLWLALGYELAADGFAPAGHHGVGARISWASSGWQAAFAAAIGLPVEDAASLASVRMQRARSAATLSALFRGNTRWSLAAGAHAGVLLHRRETIDPGPGVLARRSRWSAAFACGPEASARLQLGSIGVSAVAALDWLPSPTQFVYRDGGEQQPAVQPWRVQPRLGLSFEVAP